jgi:LPS-assembly protein
MGEARESGQGLWRSSRAANHSEVGFVARRQNQPAQSVRLIQHARTAYRRAALGGPTGRSATSSTTNALGTAEGICLRLPHMKLRIVLTLLALLLPLAARAQETNELLELVGANVQVNLRTGTATYQNGVLLKYGPVVLTAQTARVDRATGEALAEGNVILQREGGQLWRGEQLQYNFKTRVIRGETFRAGHPPYFALGSNMITSPTNQTYTITNSYFTTDDHPRPGYRIYAKQVTVVPGQSIEARHAVLYLGSVPVMYFPYYSKTLDRHPNHFDFLVGYRSTWGAYLLTTYNWQLKDTPLDGALHFDMRSRRGLAGGPDFHWEDPSFGEGIFRYYYANDENPRDVYGFETPDDDRHRLLFGHQVDLDTNLTAKAYVSYHTDPFVVRDFFESEYHANAQPRSFVEVDKAWPNWDLNGMAQFRVNDFQETVERLPDVKLTGLRQRVFETPLYYESESSVGYFRHLFPAETNFYSPFHTNSYGATRADTYHQVVLPWTFFGWLNVIPRVGQRFSYYGEANGRGATTDEEFRNVFNTGAEMTWKASRVYRGAQSDLLEVQGLRHIIEPSVNYVYVPVPNKGPHELPQFDRSLPSSRLRPIEFPDFNTIDSIDSASVMRLGLRNKLQTKREEGVDDLVNWAVYTDWRLGERHGQTTFSDLYSDLDFRPRSWLTLNSETRYGIDQGQWREANHTLTLEPNEHWSLSLGHRYRRDTPELGRGHDLLLATFYYRLNENWGLRTQHHYEAKDGTMEYQYYTLYRDFRSWTGALTFRVRENRFGSDDFTVAIALSLKAMPRFGLGSDAVRPSRLIGG